MNANVLCGIIIFYGMFIAVRVCVHVCMNACVIGLCISCFIFSVIVLSLHCLLSLIVWYDSLFCYQVKVAVLL